MAGRLVNSPYAERPEGICESGLVVVQTFGTVRNVSYKYDQYHSELMTFFLPGGRIMILEDRKRNGGQHAGQ
jgi:hypothetical protein